MPPRCSASPMPPRSPAGAPSRSTSRPPDGHSRLDAITRSAPADTGGGVAYQVQYALPPRRRRENLAGGHRPLVRRHRRQAAARASASCAPSTSATSASRRSRNSRSSIALTGEMNRVHLTEVLGATLDEAVRFRGSLRLPAGRHRSSRASQRSLRLRRRRGGDRAGRQAHPRAAARQGLSRPLLRQQVRRHPDQPARRTNWRSPPSGCSPACATRPIATAAGPVAVTVTIGGVTAPRHARTVPEILSRAQDALHAARAQAARLVRRLPAERGARRAAPRQRARDRRDRRRAQRAAHRARLRAGGRGQEPQGRVLRMPDARAAPRRPHRPCQRDHSGGRAGRADAHARLSRARTGGERTGRRARICTASVNVSPASTVDPDWWAGLGAHAARQYRRGRAADHRDHRNRGDPGRRRRARLRHPRQGSRLPHRHRRFRRRPHLVPQSAQARRRHRQDRRRLRAEHRQVGRRPRLRAHADRSGAPARPQDRRRMGAGRGSGPDCWRSGAAIICKAR